MIEKRGDGWLLKKILYYYIFCSMLFPVGIIQIFPSLKAVSVFLVWSSVVFIIFELILKYKRTKRLIPSKGAKWLILVFVMTAVITLFERGGFASGLQKIFAYPLLFFFVLQSVECDARDVIFSIRNIIVMLFIINLATMSYISSNYYHMTFLGHVQAVAQIGCLGLFSVLFAYYKYKANKASSVISALLIIISMLITDAESARYISIILIVLFVLRRFNFSKHLNLKPLTFVIIFVIANITIVGASVYNNLYNRNSIRFLDLSGRSFVWKDVLNKISERPYLGYGVDGVVIDVFWNDNREDKMYYAHNQILQYLLDGGIVLAVFAVMYLYICISNIKKVEKNNGYRYMLTVFLISYMLIMIFESPTIYCYMYIFLAMIYVLPEKIKEEENGDIKQIKE